MAQAITIGRTVRYGIGIDRDGKVVERPAIIVRVWNQEPGACNLQVFIDGGNDQCEGSLSNEECGRGVVWRTSVVRSEAPSVGTWWWPPRG